MSGLSGQQRHAWIDASAGVAGDMLLGALVDAGADLGTIQDAVDAVVPDSVRLSAAEVMRCGQRATKISVEVITEDLPHRQWSTIRESLLAASLTESVRDRALATFARLAEAEAAAHGIPAEEVHFHEVGALDSIADVVGVAAALTDLGVTSISASAVAVGSGRIRAAHGDLPVPVPAVVRLSAGWRVRAGGSGELTTPTGMALVTALSRSCEDLPAMILVGSGSGAGTKDFPDRPNITRVVLGEIEPVADRAASDGPGTESMVVLEANVDDLDPRLWPGVIERLLSDGAADAWLTPIMMKKGRPAHILSVLARLQLVEELRQVILTHTSTLGVRSYQVSRIALARGWCTVDLAGTGIENVGSGDLPGAEIRIKIGYDDSGIRQVNPEFADVARVAAAYQLPEREVLALAHSAARNAGLVLGATPPADLQPSP
ncbi:MAG: nickel pincer cofactor biosynthesis protein LarC [Microlunatus sp.]